MSSPAEMQAVILCGGLGTRMGSVAGVLPKPMLEVGGRPLLWHVMKGYARFGCRRFVLCLGHGGDAIRSWFIHGRHTGLDVTVGPGGRTRSHALGRDDAADWEVTLVETGHLTPTAGRLVRARPYLDRDRPIFMTYGDGVADIDIDALLSHHRTRGRQATVTAMRPRSRFGVLAIEGGLATRFEEKALLSERVSGGFFVMEPQLLDALPEDAPLEGEPLERLAAAGQLAAFVHDGFWLSVDTPRDLSRLRELWRQGRRPWL